MNQADAPRTPKRGGIGEGRDRLQSRLLVGIAGAVLAVEAALVLRGTAGVAREFPAHVAGVVAISMGFAVVVRLLRAATVGGAVCGALVCLVLTGATGWTTEPVWRSGLLPLFCLFVLTFLATRAGRERKRRHGLEESRRGRSAAQVLANLAVAAMCVSPLAEWLLRRWGAPPSAGVSFADLWFAAAMKTAALAALAEAAADTLASEVGQAFGGTPILVTAWQRVPPGTDGAISVLGTASGVVGAAVVAAVGGWAMHLGAFSAALAGGCGVLGLFADTVLGATVERRGWMGNDLVNFASTLAAALAALVLMRP